MSRLLLTTVCSLALLSDTVLASSDVCKSTASSCLNGGVKKCTFICLEGQKQQVECRCECPCGFIGVQCESRTGEDEPTEEESLCFSENELLLGAFTKGGDNFQVLADGSVRTMALKGRVYYTANDGNWLFYSDDTYRQLTRVNLCNLTDETVIAKFQGGQGMTQFVAVDPELKRVFVVDKPYESQDKIANTVIWSMDYYGNNKKPIVVGADEVYIMAVDHIRKNLIWVNKTSSVSGFRVEVVNYSNLDAPGPSSYIGGSDSDDNSKRPKSIYTDLKADRLYWLNGAAEIWQISLSTFTDGARVVSGPSSPTSPTGLAVVGNKFVYSDNRHNNYALWSVEAGQGGHERVKYTDYDFVGAIPSGGGLYSLHKLQ